MVRVYHDLRTVRSEFFVSEALHLCVCALYCMVPVSVCVSVYMLAVGKNRASYLHGGLMFEVLLHNHVKAVY